jgi:hypothetical protein
MPSINTLPEDGSTKRFIIRNKVVLPEPLGPNITLNSPLFIPIETSLSALVTSGKVFVMFKISRIPTSYLNRKLVVLTINTN